jgi:hypothetical protein
MFIMEVKCWNCNKTTMLEEGQVATAIKQMDDGKIEFSDVPCQFCQKSNRVEKKLFVNAYVNRHATAEKAKKK